jgi:hypothetical protein
VTPAEDRIQHEQRQQRDELLRLTARVVEVEKQLNELKEKQCQNQPQ